MPKLFTFKEACKYLNVGRNTLSEFIQTGQLKAFKIKGKWIIHEDDIEEFVEKMRNGFEQDNLENCG